MKLDIGSGGHNHMKPLEDWTHLDGTPGDHVEIVCDWKTIPLEDASVEEIHCGDVIEHIPCWELKETLGEWNRILKPGGIIHGSMPNIDRIMKDYAAGTHSFQDAVNGLYGWADSKWQQHYMTYTKETLTAMMAKHGFVIEDFSGSPGPVDRPWWLVFKGHKAASEVIKKDESGIELSLCVCVWNTSHLLRRSVQTYLKQDLPKEKWELIVIDDNSQDDVRAAIAPLEGKINVRYVRLTHRDGMRGNTVAFNTAFGMAKGNILAETTAECLLPPDALRKMLEPHYTHPRCFVALKTYNLTASVQKVIDTADWQKDILEIAKLPGWDDPTTQNNVANTHFGTHQICSIRKSVWLDITKGLGFPLFGDYGSDDPWYCGTREKADVLDITLPNECMAIHQWHAPFQYWQAKGLGPRLNKWSHSMANYLGDKSGHVPDGGTCMIWDHGQHDRLSQEDKAKWKKMDADVLATGVSEKLLV